VLTSPNLLTGDGLFLVLDGCPRLATLGLRSCRGVRVGDRRRFFEVRVRSFWLVLATSNID
jgi:hypothetical protein